MPSQGGNHGYHFFSLGDELAGDRTHNCPVSGRTLYHKAAVVQHLSFSDFPGTSTASHELLVKTPKH